MVSGGSNPGRRTPAILQLDIRTLHPGFRLIGWFLWRLDYLLQLPTFLRKARVPLDWPWTWSFPRCGMDPDLGSRA